MDAQRALLDSLMGLNRDGDRPDDATLDFKHPKVCKSYLCGLCPRELFQNTRLDTGACELLHVPALRSAFQQQVDKRDFGYERQLANELSKLLADVERKITRAQKRLDEDGDNQDKMQIMQLTQDMQDSAAQAEQAAKNGNADKSLQLMEQVEQLKAKRRELLRECNAAGIHTNGVAMMVDNVNQKLRVCDVCGAFLSIFDSDQRLADHFAGKIHVGYVQIRKKLKELMTAMKDRKDDIPKGRRSVSKDKSVQDVIPRRRNSSSCTNDRDRSRGRDRSRSQGRRRHSDRLSDRHSRRNDRKRRPERSSRSRSESRWRKRNRHRH